MDRKFVLDRLDDAVDERFPSGIGQLELFRLQLPNAADFGVHQRLFTAAVRRLRSHGNQRFGLGWANGKTNCSDTRNVPSREHRIEAAMHAETGRLAKLIQDVKQLLRNGQAISVAISRLGASPGSCSDGTGASAQRLMNLTVIVWPILSGIFHDLCDLRGRGLQTSILPSCCTPRNAY